MRFAVNGLVKVALLSLVVAMSRAAMADNFADVRYDPGDDTLVVSMAYRGTDPNHVFSLKWGRCKGSLSGGGREIVAEVIDSQWRDEALHDFVKTTRFPLSGLSCRPAKVTLRTAPRFYYTIQVPARVAASP